ncbi:hypothetical protein MRX96_018334 [Rhipicephalus microplus]
MNVPRERDPRATRARRALVALRPRSLWAPSVGARSQQVCRLCAGASEREEGSRIPSLTAALPSPSAHWSLPPTLVVGEGTVPPPLALEEGEEDTGFVSFERRRYVHNAAPLPLAPPSSFRNKRNSIALACAPSPPCVRLLNYFSLSHPLLALNADQENAPPNPGLDYSR